MDNKLQNIIKANSILTNKIEELEEFIKNFVFQDFNENEKFNKVYISESGKLYINKIIAESANFKKNLSNEIEKLNRNNYDLFIKKLINNYAKVEDSYFTLLAESKNLEIGAIALFKIDGKLKYLKNNLQTVNNEINHLTKMNLEEKTF